MLFRSISGVTHKSSKRKLLHMISKQFQTKNTNLPKAVNRQKSGSSRIANFLPLPPSPEEKNLMVAKARKLNATALKIELENIQTKWGHP